MTPSDDLWVELTQFDTRLADGVWDGAIPPDGAPPWSRALESLVAAARGPAAPDELVHEAEILANMRAAPPPYTRAERRPRHRAHVLGGVAAAKALIAVVTALGAAATTTGLVVTLVAPHPPEPGHQPVEPSRPSVSGPGPSTTSRDGARATDGHPGNWCTAIEIGCPATTVYPTEPRAQTHTPTGGSTQGAAGASSAALTGNESTAPASPPATTEHTTPGSEDTPDNSSSAPAHAESPTSSNSAPDRGGSASSPPASPGNRESAPAHAESPTSSNSAPGAPPGPPGASAVARTRTTAEASQAGAAAGGLGADDARIDRHTAARIVRGSPADHGSRMCLGGERVDRAQCPTSTVPRVPAPQQ